MFHTMSNWTIQWQAGAFFSLSGASLLFEYALYNGFTRTRPFLIGIKDLIGLQSGYMLDDKVNSIKIRENRWK